MRLTLSLLVLLLLPATAGAATLNATPSTLASVYSSAQGGDTILLAAGSYSQFSGAVKSSTVTLQPASGAVSMNGAVFTNASNTTIRGVRFTGTSCSTNSTNIVFDADTFDNLPTGCREGRLSFVGGSGTVSNSHFGGEGCSDGIFLTNYNGTGGGDSRVNLIGNTFEDLHQAGCGPHVDAVQYYGGRSARVEDNFVRNVSTGIMGYDSNGQVDVFKNNVVVSTETGQPVTYTGQHNGSFTHNVVVAANIQLDPGHNNDPPTGNTLKDNVAGVNVIGGSGNTVTNNLTSGQVTFVGGTGRCAYATKTPKGTASDGTDMGLNDCGAPTGIYASPSGSGSICSQAAPCSTSGAEAKAGPGDTITLMDGNYGSQSWTKGGTASARLRWVAQNRFGARFTSINTIGAFVDIGPGLNVSNPGITCGSNISPIGSGGADNYVGAHDVVVTGNWIHDIGTNASGWATSGCRDGGGIYVSSPSWTLTNNLIENVISDCITSWHSPSNMKAINNTVVNCGGGGVNLGGQTGGGYAVNNIAVNANLGGLYSNSTNTWVNNLVFGGRTSAGVSGDTGTIVADPRFISSTDRHLQSGSPAIDSGTSNQAPAVDIEGTTRTVVDRGAYEAVGGPTDHTPVARFTVSPEPSSPGQTTTFNATSSTCEDTPCTYHWHDIAGGGDWPLGPNGATSTMVFQAQHPASAPVMAELVLTDSDGDVAKVEHDHVVSSTPPPDTTPPDTIITSAPSDGPGDGAYYDYQSTESGSTFKCQYDQTVGYPCPPPRWFPNQSLGTHTFKVWAVDAAGNMDPTPATSTWTRTP